MKILIAEDDPISGRVLETNLVSWGYEVVSTLNGAQAWAEFQKADAPRLAILDILMPEMSGLEVCRKVRQMPNSSPPYIILLTAKKKKEDVVAGIEAGANDYLTKPIYLEEFRVRLEVGVRMVELQQSLAKRVRDLEEALAHVRQLQGILPICSYCKKIRDDQNYWHQVENYISTYSDTRFSHSVCPDCYRAEAESQFQEKND
jgi:sigma-B regulation protein RsbU (phosphoserine phosphatase)